MTKKCAKCGTDKRELMESQTFGCHSANPYDKAGQNHQWVDQEPQKAEECGCEGKSCKEGCSEDHSHKGFRCEKCYPVLADANGTYLVKADNISGSKADERPWWEDKSGFSDWFDKEYGTDDASTQALGIVASALSHARMMPAGSDASYITRKLETIISRTVSESLRMAAERVRGLKRETPSELDIGSEFSTPRIIRANGFNQGLDEAAEAIIRLSN